MSDDYYQTPTSDRPSRQSCLAMIAITLVLVGGLWAIVATFSGVVRSVANSNEQTAVSDTASEAVAESEAVNSPELTESEEANVAIEEADIDEDEMAVSPEANDAPLVQEEEVSPLDPSIIVPPSAETVIVEEVVIDEASLNRIAYINTDFQVVTIAPDGTKPLVLTEDSDRLYRFPVWSPDGDYIAAIGSRSNGSGVYAIPTTQNEREDISELYFDQSESPFYLYWSPDSQHLSFLANHQTENIGMHLANLANEESRILSTGSPFYWDWSSDGAQLFIHVGGIGESSRLSIIDAAGDGSGDNIAAPGFFQSPGISPSSEYIAFAEQIDERESQVVVTNITSGEQQTVQHDGFVAMSWSPTRNQLAFISNDENRASFWGPLQMMDAETGEIRLLHSGTVFAFFWSPNGRYIAYLAPVDEDEGGNALLEFETPRNGRLAKPSAQGRDRFFISLRVVDTQTGAVRLLDAFEPTRLFVTQYLPYFDQYALSHRIWAPDSSAIVLPQMFEDDTAHVMVVPLNGDAKVDVGEGEMAFWSHQ